MTFTPELWVDLNFTDSSGAPKVVYAETAPGSGVFEAVTSTRIRAGENIELIHTGGDLEIDTDYVLTGTFHNETKLYITPAFDLSLLTGTVQVDLNDFDNLNLFKDSDLQFSFGVQAFRKSFPFHSPIPLTTLADPTFTYESFAEVDGSALSLSATPSSTFDVLAGLDQVSLEEGDSVTASVVISDPNAAADDSDVYEVEIDWGDGTTETCTADNTGPLPAYAGYDAQNHVLTATHLYPEDTATQPDPRFPPETYLAAMSFTATKLTPGSADYGTTDTAPGIIEVVDVAPELTSVDLSLDDSGGATLKIDYVDQGVLDTHRLGISWSEFADPETGLPPFSWFQLARPSALHVGDTVNASNGTFKDAVLTVTSVDPAAGEVSVTITGYTYTERDAGTSLDIDLTDDENFGSLGSTRVPIGLDLTSFTLPASMTENGDVTLAAQFTAVGYVSSGLTDFRRHDVVIDWDDENDAPPATFTLFKAQNLDVGKRFTSTTDDSVLTITDIQRLDRDGPFGYDLAVTFEVTHRYLDDGLAGGNGTGNDSSTVVLDIFEDVFDFARGATANQTIDVVNVVRLTGGELQIVGTEGADDVGVKYRRHMGVVTDVNVETQFAGQSKLYHSFNTAAVSGITVYACGGDDVVTIQDQVAVDAVIRGRAGNDLLTGGGGNDNICGGGGNDVLIGGNGNGRQRKRLPRRRRRAEHPHRRQRRRQPDRRHPRRRDDRRLDRVRQRRDRTEPPAGGMDVRPFLRRTRRQHPQRQGGRFEGDERRAGCFRQ